MQSNTAEAEAPRSIALDKGMREKERCRKDRLFITLSSDFAKLPINIALSSVSERSDADSKL